MGRWVGVKKCKYCGRFFAYIKEHQKNCPLKDEKFEKVQE